MTIISDEKDLERKELIAIMTSLRKDVPESFDAGEPWMDRMMKMEGLISDFKQLYLVQIGENERPFDKIMKNFSNDLVEEWYETSLVPNATVSKKMTSQEMTDRWYSFYEAKQTKFAIQYWNLGLHPSKDIVEKWTLLFDGPIEELAILGSRTIRDGFSIMIAAYDDWFVKQKHDLCFSSDDPNEWLEKFKYHKKLFTREIEPFDMQAIREKMTALVHPMNEPGPKKEQLIGKIDIPH